MEQLRKLFDRNKSDTKTSLFKLNVEKYHKQLLRHAITLCGDPVLAEDILQNAYCRAWIAIRSLKDWSRFRPWLKVIIQRENARFFSKHFYSDEYEEDKHAVVETNNYNESIVSIHTIAYRVDELPYKYKAAIVLHLVGFNGEEIASRLNITVNTVYTRIRRARERLKGGLTF